MACRLGRDLKHFMRKPPNLEFEVGTRAVATVSAAPALLYLLALFTFSVRVSLDRNSDRKGEQGLPTPNSRNAYTTVE
jgi:hypothetical protein